MKDSELAHEYKVNSHHTTVIHKDTLVVVAEDPAEYVEHFRSPSKRIANTLTRVFTWTGGIGGLGLALTSLCILMGAGADFILGTDDFTLGMTLTAAVFGGGTVGLIVTAIAGVCLTEHFAGTHVGNPEDFAILVLPLGEPGTDVPRAEGTRTAFAERVTTEVRDQLRDMVNEGHKRQATNTLTSLLRATEKQWDTEGEAQGKVLSKLMNS